MNNATKIYGKGSPEEALYWEPMPKGSCSHCGTEEVFGDHFHTHTHCHECGSEVEVQSAEEAYNKADLYLVQLWPPRGI